MSRLFLGFLFLLAAGFLWGWALWPPSYTEKEIALPNITFSDPQFSDTVSQLNALDLHARLRYPTSLHAGDSGVIQVAFITSDPASDGGLITQDSQVMMEARIDLPLAQLSPQGGIVETLPANALPFFRWQIVARQAGQLSGQFWLYVLLVTEEGPTERQALLAVPFETDIHALEGLPDHVLIWIASGFTLAGLLVFPVARFLKSTDKTG